MNSKGAKPESLTPEKAAAGYSYGLVKVMKSSRRFCFQAASSWP
jgi:hypothetical protein